MATSSVSLPSSQEKNFLHPITLLEALLKETIDSTESVDKKEQQLLSVCDALIEKPILDGALEIIDGNSALTIRHITAPLRTAYLVQTSSGRSKGSRSNVSHYYCQTELPYCSCRSYFERAKVDPKALCKHLLAIKLLPYLTNSEIHVEKIAEERFASLVVEAAFSD